MSKCVGRGVWSKGPDPLVLPSGAQRELRSGPLRPGVQVQGAGRDVPGDRTRAAPTHAAVWRSGEHRKLPGTYTCLSVCLPECLLPGTYMCLPGTYTCQLVYLSV